MSLDPLLPSLDDADGPARRLSRDEHDDAVASVLDAWDEERPAAPAAPPSRAGWAAAGGLVVGFLLAGSMAAALYVVMREPAPSPQPPPMPAVEPSRTAPSVEPAQAEVPEVPPAEAPQAETEAAEPEPTADDDAPPSPRQSADLLARANALRGARDFRGAAQLYGRAARGSGGSAHAAAVAAGELELEHLGHPRRALSMFRRASRLRSGGPLDVSVLEGTARAARRLGDGASERTALEALVRRHSGSSAARRATARLEELGD